MEQNLVDVQGSTKPHKKFPPTAFPFDRKVRVFRVLRQNFLFIVNLVDQRLFEFVDEPRKAVTQVLCCLQLDSHLCVLGFPVIVIGD